MYKTKITLLLVILLGFSVNKPMKGEVNNALVETESLIQMAILLDTSGSMSGLIDQAKTQLWSIVNEFNFLNLDKEDLLQEARIGFVRAVPAFEWWKGFKFSSFASKYMRIQIGYFARHSGKYPKGYFGRMKYTIKKLNAKGLEITPENITEVVNISLAQAEEFLNFKILSFLADFAGNFGFISLRNLNY